MDFSVKTPLRGKTGYRLGGNICRSPGKGLTLNTYRALQPDDSSENFRKPNTLSRRVRESTRMANNKQKDVCLSY